MLFIKLLYNYSFKSTVLSILLFRVDLLLESFENFCQEKYLFRHSLDSLNILKAENFKSFLIITKVACWHYLSIMKKIEYRPIKFLHYFNRKLIVIFLDYLAFLLIGTYTYWSITQRTSSLDPGSNNITLGRCDCIKVHDVCEIYSKFTAPIHLFLYT